MEAENSYSTLQYNSCETQKSLENEVSFKIHSNLFLKSLAAKQYFFFYKKKKDLQA